MKVRTLVGIGSIFALAAAGCGSSSKTASTSNSSGGTATAAATGASLGPNFQALENLYHQAVAAGQNKVVIYGPSAGTDTAMYAAFKKAFPEITVTGVPAVGPPMSAKLGAEFSSGKHVGDIAYTGSTDMMEYSQEGWFNDFSPVTAPDPSKMTAENIGPNNSFYGVTVGVAGVVYNTSTVKTPPDTWQALENPSYKGKIAMYDPTAVGEMEDVFAHLALDPADAGAETALKTDQPQLFPASSLTGPITAVAQGSKQLAVLMPYNFFSPAQQGGAPVGFTLLKSGNYTVSLYMGQLKGAPDPLAAQLYEDWMYTPNAAAAIASEGEYSAVLGAVAPKGLPPLASIAQLPPIPLANIVAADNASIARARQLGF